jgi:DNA polymerase-1
MPSNAARSGTRGLPPFGLGDSAGSNGPITSHNPSLTKASGIFRTSDPPEGLPPSAAAPSQHHAGQHDRPARSLPGAQEVTKQERKLAKAVNFGLLYGMSPGGLRNYARASYGVEMTKEEAERYWQHFFEAYPGLRAWHDREYVRLKKYGKTETRTLSGRRRTGVTKLTERLNSPVQGTGADGLKLALALLYERRGECPGAVPILAVHDEVVAECPEEQAEEVKVWLVKAMVDGMEEVLNSGPDNDDLERVPVRVEVEVVDSWGEG